MRFFCIWCLTPFVDAAISIDLVEIEVELFNKSGCDCGTSSGLLRRDLPQLVPESRFHWRHRPVRYRICCTRLRLRFRSADDVACAVGGTLLNDAPVLDR